MGGKDDSRGMLGISTVNKKNCGLLNERGRSILQAQNAAAAYERHMFGHHLLHKYEQ